MKIVNPWLIYWITRCDAIVTLALIAAIVGGILAIFFAIFALVEWDEDKRKAYKKAVKMSLIVCLVGSLVTTFVPDKQTCIEMLIADKVTYESVDAGIDAVKEATDYICDKIKEVK